MKGLEPDLAPGESYDVRTIHVPLVLAVRIKTYHRPSESLPWDVCVGPEPMPAPDRGPPSERAADFKSGVDALVSRATKAINAGLEGTAFRLLPHAAETS